jgi:hypothetical protein
MIGEDRHTGVLSHRAHGQGEVGPEQGAGERGRRRLQRPPGFQVRLRHGARGRDLDRQIAHDLSALATSAKAGVQPSVSDDGPSSAQKLGATNTRALGYQGWRSVPS